jgi:hypothetical protein
MTIRRDTIARSRQIDDAQFLPGWNAGERRRPCRAERLRVAVGGTYLPAVPREEVTKFEVVAGRVERDRTMGRRFACALPRRARTQTLVDAALAQGGWASQTQIEVMSDAEMGMRSLVEAVAPTLAKPTLDWFHLSMKVQAVMSALGTYTMAPTPRPPFMVQSKRSGNRIRGLLWRGHTDEAIQLTSTLITSLEAEALKLSSFYSSAADTARGAATRLLECVRKNRADIINYNGARRSGRRISRASTESARNYDINRRM